jgi:hypothetical protein
MGSPAPAPDKGAADKKEELVPQHGITCPCTSLEAWASRRVVIEPQTDRLSHIVAARRGTAIELARPGRPRDRPATVDPCSGNRTEAAKCPGIGRNTVGRALTK